jgi:hypothetical protein
MTDNQNTSLLDSVFTSYIGRIVAFVLTPLLLPIVGAVAYWVQNVIGIDLQAHVAIATGFIVSVVAGTALAIYQWLRNRGIFEKTVLELHHLYEAGNQLIAQEQTKSPTNLTRPGALQTGDDVPTTAPLGMQGE